MTDLIRHEIVMYSPAAEPVYGTVCEACADEGIKGCWKGLASHEDKPERAVEYRNVSCERHRGQKRPRELPSESDVAAEEMEWRCYVDGVTTLLSKVKRRRRSARVDADVAKWAHETPEERTKRALDLNNWYCVTLNREPTTDDFNKCMSSHCGWHEEAEYRRYYGALDWNKLEGVPGYRVCNYCWDNVADIITEHPFTKEAMSRRDEYDSDEESVCDDDDAADAASASSHSSQA